MRKIISALVLLILSNAPLLAQEAPSSSSQKHAIASKSDVDEVAPTAEQQSQFIRWLRQREEIQNEIKILDAQINGGLIILMSQVLHLDPKDGWKPIDDKKGGIKFVRVKAPEAGGAKPSEAKP